MTSAHYVATQAALADPSYQTMQDVNGSLSSIGDWSDKASAAYQDHFGSVGKNIANGLIAVGLGGIAISGLGEAALAAETAWQMTFLALDSLAAVYNLAGGSFQTVVGLAQLSQPDPRVDNFVMDLASDPFNLFIGFPYGVLLGGTPGNFGTAVERAKWLSFFYSGLSTKIALTTSTSRLVNGAGVAGFFKAAADRWTAPADVPPKSPAGNLPSQSANRDLFGTPENYIFGDPQAPSDGRGGRAPNIYGDSLPVALGGGDPSPTATPTPDPTPNPAPTPQPDPIADPSQPEDEDERQDEDDHEDDSGPTVGGGLL